MSHFAHRQSACTRRLWPLFGNLSGHGYGFFSTNSQFTHAPPAPSTPARTAEFPWRRYSSRPIERQVAIPPRCEPPLPSACRALGLSVGVVGKFSQPVTLHSQDDLPDERDTRSAFPSHLSKVDFGAFARECVEKNSAGFLARVIREACLRVQGNLETVVEFLLRLRRPGLSRVDHWLRPQPARMAPFIAGADTHPLVVGRPTA